MNSKRRSLYKEGYIEDFYAIEEDEALGEGGSGVVRKAIRRETGESVAIKIIDK